MDKSLKGETTYQNPSEIFTYREKNFFDSIMDPFSEDHPHFMKSVATIVFSNLIIYICK